MGNNKHDSIQAAWEAFQNQPWGKHVDLATFTKIIDEGATPLDVRTQQEFDAGHIPGAIHIDVSSYDFGYYVDKLDKTKPYAVYCFSGSRSLTAVSRMKYVGFDKVAGLEGGVSVWDGPIEQGIPSEDAQ
ncbi:MAG: rhodanese-like domain-containing protein [Actinomycetaceae bacterium]|nr:rhodanese-like domain-containing protein [Actinomycetaceae bacterium]